MGLLTYSYSSLCYLLGFAVDSSSKSLDPMKISYVSYWKDNLKSVVWFYQYQSLLSWWHPVIVWRGWSFFTKFTTCFSDLPVSKLVNPYVLEKNSWRKILFNIWLPSCVIISTVQSRLNEHLSLLLYHFLQCTNVMYWNCEIHEDEIHNCDTSS